MKTTETVGVVLMTLGIVLMVVVLTCAIHEAIENPNPEVLTKEVNCYDRFSNKIQGAVCEKKYFAEDDAFGLVFAGFLTSTFLILAGATMYGSEGYER